MAMAYPGITHCSECGSPLGIGEFGVCTDCENEEKELSADEMFKKIGYKFDNNESCHNMIIYKKRFFSEKYENCLTNEIIFLTDEKKVAKSDYNGLDDLINIDELKAINKKIEEMGW